MVQKYLMDHISNTRRKGTQCYKKGLHLSLMKNELQESNEIEDTYFVNVVG